MHAAPIAQDDANLAALGIKPGQKLMLMGSAEVLAAAPEKATVFAEDLPQEELDAAEATNPAGLANLGNTCYLNSSLQCMRAVPEISTALQKFVGGSDGPYGEANGFISAMQQLNSELDRSNSAKEVKPFKFVSLFRTAYPMFAQQNEQGGGFMQQASCSPTRSHAPSSPPSRPSPSPPSPPLPLHLLHHLLALRQPHHRLLPHHRTPRNAGAR